MRSQGQLFHVDITALTDAAGAATAYSDKKVTGEIVSVHYIKTDYEDTVDFTITTETTAQTIWTQTNRTAAQTNYPRAPTVDGVAAASLYAAAGEPVEDRIAVASERIKVVIASGGAAKTGLFRFILRS